MGIHTSEHKMEQRCSQLDEGYMKSDCSEIKPRLPFQTHGFGQFRPYEAWSAPVMVVTGPNKHRTTRQSMHSAGFPLYAMKEGVILPKNSSVFSAGISVNIPFGHFGKILPISGLVFKKGIVPILTIINENNTDDIKICLMNHSDSPHNVVNGDCIGQLVIQRYTVPRTLVSVENARVINIK